MLNKSEKQSSLIALVMGVIFLLTGLVFLIGSWGAYFTDTKIQDSGPSAEGHLEKKLFMRVADGDSDYILEYWFMTKEGSAIRASRNVSKRLWSAVHEGQIIEIKYSANNPKRNFPLGAGVTSIGMAIFASVFGLTFTIFGGALIWGYYRNVLTQAGRLAAPLNSNVGRQRAMKLRNNAAAFDWGFSAVFLLMCMLFTYILIRDGSSPIMPLVLAIFWYAGIAIAISVTCKPCISIEVQLDRSVVVVNRYPVSRSVRHIKATDLSPAQVVKATDSDGDPYFRATVISSDGFTVCIAEGHDQERCESVCTEFNAAIGKQDAAELQG